MSTDTGAYQANPLVAQFHDQFPPTESGLTWTSFSRGRSSLADPCWRLAAGREE